MSSLLKPEKLSNLARIVTGSTPPTSNEENFSDDGIEWIKPENLMGLAGISASKQRVSRAAVKNMEIIPPGSVLVNCIGDVGKFGFTDRPVVTNQQINATIFRKDRVLPSYGKYLIASSKSAMEKQANKVVVAILNKSGQSSIVYNIPDLNTQTKIANYLDHKTQTLDKILTAKNHTHTHLSELRQAIITNAVLGTGGATMSTSVKNTWVGATPDHWKITKLSHVARIKTGGTPSRENLDYWTDGNIPWLASGEVNKGIIATVDNHITPLGMANSNATILPIDTVMIALNGQGKTKGMAALLKVPATCNQSLAGVICDKDKINPRYLYYYLKSKYSNIRGIKGEARDGLNLDIIGSISVPLPPMEEQLAIIEQIERRINKIDKTEVKLSESIKLLEEYRSSLISNVVGGKVEI